jgi:hypothetical protein
LALLVTNCIPFSDNEKAKEWEQKIRKLFTSFLELEYGIKLPEHTEKELNMLKFYQDKVKGLKPILKVTEKGKFVVSGLDSLKD